MCENGYAYDELKGMWIECYERTCWEDQIEYDVYEAEWLDQQEYEAGYEYPIEDDMYEVEYEA